MRNIASCVHCDLSSGDRWTETLDDSIKGCTMTYRKGEYGGENNSSPVTARRRVRGFGVKNAGNPVRDLLTFRIGDIVNHAVDRRLVGWALPNPVP
jgi:hypothetical protein